MHFLCAKAALTDLPTCPLCSVRKYESAQFLSRLSGVDVGTSFSIKALLHERPIRFVGRDPFEKGLSTADLFSWS